MNKNYICKEYYNNLINDKKKYKNIFIIHFLKIEKFPFMEFNLLQIFNELLIKKVIEKINNINYKINNKQLDDELFFHQKNIIGITDNAIYYDILRVFLLNYYIKIIPLFDGLFIKISFFIFKKELSIRKMLKYINYIYISKLFDNIVFDAYSILFKKYNLQNYNQINYTFYRPILNYYIVIKNNRKKIIYNNLKISSYNFLINEIPIIYNKIKYNLLTNKIYQIVKKNKIFLVYKKYSIININLEQLKSKNKLLFNNIPDFIIDRILKNNYNNYFNTIRRNKLLSINFIINNKKKITKIKKFYTRHILLRFLEISKHIETDLKNNYTEIKNIYNNITFLNNKEITILKKNSLIFNLAETISQKKYNSQLYLFFDMYISLITLKHININKNYLVSYFISKIQLFNKEEKEIIHHLYCNNKICYKYTNYFKSKNKNCLINVNIFLYNFINKLFVIIYLFQNYLNFSSSKDPFFIKKKIYILLNIYQLFLLKKRKVINIFDLINKIIDINNNKIIQHLVNFFFNTNNINISNVKLLFNKYIKQNNLDLKFNIFILKNIEHIIFFKNIIKGELFHTMIKRINGILKNNKEFNIKYKNININELILILEKQKHNFAKNFIFLLKKYKSINNLKLFQHFINNFIILLKYLFDNIKIKNNNNKNIYLKILFYIKYIFLYLFIL